MTVNRLDPEREELFTKFRLANLAYDIYNIRLFGVSNNDILPAFDSLPERTKHAWAAAIDTAVDTAKKTKSPKSESISKKEEDNGYIVYNGCKEIKKDHPSLFTYAKFPEEVKEKYRNLAAKLYGKMENDEVGGD